MKRTVFIFCTLSLLCSCMKQEETGVPAYDSNSLTAVISDNSTKAILIDNPGVKVQSFWVDGDAISVFGADGANKRFSVTAADISKDGKTADFKSAGDIPAGELIALSPYSADAVAGGAEISFTFPAVQHLAIGNGVPQADPQANIMVGRGSRTAGVRFTNVMSILKTGMYFEQATVLRSIEFRDLSGSSVSGKTVIKWSGSTPSAEIAGQGGNITLDLGEEGLALAAGELKPFYLIVPARNYTKGFEITFVTKSGDRIVKVSGTKMGKELCSGVLYTVGDIDNNMQIPGAKSVLKPNATLMTDDKLDLIQITSISNRFIYDENGNYLEGPSGFVQAPEVTAIVHRDLQPAVGNWMLFDHYTDDMPKGALLKIKSCTQLDPDHFEIWAVSDPDVAAPFEELVAGTPLYDEAGNELKDGGFEIDASRIESIVDRSGNPVEFSLDSNGDLIFDENTTSRLLGTKAAMNRTFTTPTLSKTFEGRGCEMTVGARLNLGMKAALGIVHGEFQYIHMVCNPKIEISTSFSLKGSAELKESFHFITLKFGAIVVAGLICTPQLEIWGKMGVGGEIEFQTSITYTKDLGNFGLSYNIGDGITVRHSLAPNSPDDIGTFTPQIGGLTGSINVVAGLEFKPCIGVYGLLSCGVECDCSLKFGMNHSTMGYTGTKFALTPEVELSPYIRSVGGILNKKFNSMAKIQWDPVWEKYITPNTRIGYVSNVYRPSDYITMRFTNGRSLDSKVPMEVTGIHYKITLSGDTFSDIELGIKYWDASDLIYSPDMDALHISVDEWKDSGLESVGLYLGEIKAEPVGLTVAGSEILGTYEAETDEKTFEGIVRHNFSNNVPHGYTFFIQRGDEIISIGSGSSDYPYNAFVVYWPNRSNGQPYFLGP